MKSAINLGKHDELVSIVIPVHDVQKTKKCLEALREQTYRRMETIQVKFKGFPAEKRNYGFEKSKGSLILFLDEDEYLSPTVIEECVRRVESGCDIVSIPVIKTFGENYFSQCLSVIREKTEKTMFFKRYVLLDIGLFDPRFILCDDLDILERAAMKNYRVGTISNGHMLHDENVTIHNVILKTIFGRKAFKRLRTKFGYQVYQRMVSASYHRRRIIKELLGQPKYIPGVLMIMAMRALIRRIP